MDIVTILKAISIALGALCTSIIPLIISLIKTIKARKQAKTNEARAEAEKQMLTVVNSFIEQAEALYQDVDAILKSRGKSSGPNKKDSVMTKLQAYALENGFSFDADYWSAKIDAIVEMTRKVNSK